jgi:hypothetical protein
MQHSDAAATLRGHDGTAFLSMLLAAGFGAGLVTLFPAPCRCAPALLAARLLTLRRACTRCEATIDHKLRTGHVPRCVGGEK